MRKPTLIVTAVAASILLPLAAATKSSKRSSSAKSSSSPAAAEKVEGATAEKAATKSRSKSSSKSAGKSAAEPAAETKAKLPSKQIRAQKLVSDLTTTQKSKLLAFLNEADLKELAVVKGISTTRAGAIDKARPFDSIDEVILVTGIGDGTFGEIVKHGKTLTLSRTASTDASESSQARRSS